MAELVSLVPPTQSAIHLCVPQQAPGATWAALLGGHALLPDMLFPTVNRFKPANGPLRALPKGAARSVAVPACRMQGVSVTLCQAHSTHLGYADQFI